MMDFHGSSNPGGGAGAPVNEWPRHAHRIKFQAVPNVETTASFKIDFFPFLDYSEAIVEHHHDYETDEILSDHPAIEARLVRFRETGPQGRSLREVLAERDIEI